MSITETLKDMAMPKANGDDFSPQERDVLRAQARAYIDGKWALCLIYRAVTAVGIIAGAVWAVWELWSAFRWGTLR